MKFTNMFWLLATLVFTHCKSADTLNETNVDTVSILGDPDFANGLSLKGTNSENSPTGKFLYPFGKAQVNTSWELAEWGSKYQLSQDIMTTEGSAKVYRDPGKMISFEKQGEDHHIKMGITTSNEYDAPRRAGEPWPHLLLEQAFSSKPKLLDIKSLMLNFEGRLADIEMKMPESAFDPGLHAAQFQLFITVQDLNPQSARYGDYFWFGIPFYDSRYRQAEVYAAKDIGKDDATGKFIYSLASRDFMEGSFHDKQWITINKDLYPAIIKALSIARERGYLAQSSDADLQISGMNIGWEVPGTFDAVFEFKVFDLSIVR